MDSKAIAGPVKAAILIHALGAPLADQLLERLSEPERARIEEHLSQIRTIAPEVVVQVAREFAAIRQRRKSEQNALLVTDSGHPRITVAEPSDAEVSAVDENYETSGLAAVKSLDADEVYDLIKEEQPQTIAIILVHLKTSVASDVKRSSPRPLCRICRATR